MRNSRQSSNSNTSSQHSHLGNSDNGIYNEALRIPGGHDAPAAQHPQQQHSTTDAVESATTAQQQIPTRSCPTDRRRISPRNRMRYPEATFPASQAQQPQPTTSNPSFNNTAHNDFSSIQHSSCLPNNSATPLSSPPPSHQQHPSSPMKQQDIVMVVPRGYRLRDEFVCPITRDLIVDPVIAADGHTYDRLAITRWFSNNTTSPKTGESLHPHHSHLIPNHNLKRLLNDILKENNVGALLLPVSSDTPTNNNHTRGSTPSPPPLEYNDEDKEVALVREKVLAMKCLGPSESDWVDRTFRVTKTTPVLGGRRPNSANHANSPPENDVHSEMLQFGDATVSRRHFEILWDERVESFRVRDLGSAGGTFVRIRPGERVELKDGDMFMIGKHQMMVLDPESVAGGQSGGDPEADRTPTQSPVPESRSRPPGLEELDLTDWNENELASDLRRELALDAETPRITASIAEMWESYEDKAEKEASAAALSTCQEEEAVEVQQPVVNVPPTHPVSNAAMNTLDWTLEKNMSELDIESDDEEVSAPTLEPGVSPRPSLLLKCFAPEGTPIQNVVFPVYSSSQTTLGRKKNNTISFSCNATHTHSTAAQGVTDARAGDDNVLVGIDSSISGMHATISHNCHSDCMELADGVAAGGSSPPAPKGSTNGTWVRLSPMHVPSDYFTLCDKSEILIGTVRFQVSVEEIVVERDVIN